MYSSPPLAFGTLTAKAEADLLDKFRSVARPGLLDPAIKDIYSDTGAENLIVFATDNITFADLAINQLIKNTAFSRVGYMGGVWPPQPSRREDPCDQGGR